jgi:hypothetical protein
VRWYLGIRARWHRRTRLLVGIWARRLSGIGLVGVVVCARHLTRERHMWLWEKCGYTGGGVEGVLSRQ